MKHLVIPAVILCLILFGNFFEQRSLKQNFGSLTEKLELVSLKIDEKTASEGDFDEINNWWSQKKKFMHAYLPHTEIQEIDLWLSEAKSYLKDGEYAHAQAKVRTVITLAESVPRSFKFSFENLF